ncbi:MAG: nitrogen regulation protein NR(II) [Candidatus Zixiibacteriota bacterium]
MVDYKLNKNIKITFIVISIAITIGFHYGWLWEPFFGHVHWLHALHGRFCYIPIVIAASWFGLRGGLYTAIIISVLVLPYIFSQGLDSDPLASELVEIVFYLAIAILTGALIERELSVRQKHEQAKLQLEKSHKLSLVGQIAAGVAHEIKNPLASIKGSVEILTDDSTIAKDKDEFKNIIFNEIKRIDSTVTNFLELAKPKETKLEKINLSNIIETGLKQMETHAAKSNINIKSDIADGIFINGDSEKIHQVLLNLILNAIQASTPGSDIDVMLSTSSKYVDLIVKDFGIGIKEEEIDKIFDPFYTTKPSGSGLGLSLVKSTIEKHNGCISVQSNPENGTEVTITFPMQKGKMN